MSTNGAYGFYINGQEKATYNHSDSYPSWLGKRIIEVIKNSSLEKLKCVAETIELIQPEGKPTNEQIEHCKPFSDFGVSTGETDDWYCLLLNAQGDLQPYMENKLKYMVDNKEFLHNSLFCEWAYIINLDENKLEVYKGFNKNPKARGRYASKTVDFDKEYCGVRLIKTIKLEKLFSLTDQEQNKLIETLEGK